MLILSPFSASLRNVRPSSTRSIAVLLFFSFTFFSAVEGELRAQQVVRVTGVRFSYPVVQHWIDEFSKTHPDIQVIIESRGTSDPSQYDVLVEAFEHSDQIQQEREYLYVGRYAVLPIANSKSAFAKYYSEKGLDKTLITQLFFHDLYSDKEKLEQVKAAYTIYTRLQKAGAPIVFSNYFGYEQRDINGKAIAGGDEHLLKAVLRDSAGVSYAPVPLIYDRGTQKPVEGLTVIPVDLNGNGKVSDEERFYGELPAVVQHLDVGSAKAVANVPIAYLHFSVGKKTATAEAITFLRWILENSEKDLYSFGYLKPEPGKLDKVKFEQFATKNLKQ